MDRQYDFCGWATRNDVECADGRTIRRDAFKECDGTKVPVVWNHGHSSVSNVLGHALLENRPEGVYAYGYFNSTPAALDAKESLVHGDIVSLSIYANQLRQRGGDVLHGAIREVSLVLAGANPGAYIEDVVVHGEAAEGEGVIYSGLPLGLAHAEEPKEKEAPVADDKEETVQDVIDSMSEKQRNVLYGLVGAALSGGEDDLDEEDDNQGDNSMKHNVFDSSTTADAKDQELMHSLETAVLSDWKKHGTMQDAFLAHADDYGIKQIDWLFPEATELNRTPEFINHKTDWVAGVLSGVHRSPFSRIKTTFADIREDEARAKGYIKGNRKKEEVFTLLKRTTTPTTIYKKQKLDRDDIVDITDFDVVSWMKGEMRGKLDEEIARAILIGDGRLSSSDDKISEDNVRPVWTDDDLFSVKVRMDPAIAEPAKKAKNFIDSVIRSRKHYRGSGNPTLYTTEDVVTECLLMEDEFGHKVYKTEEELRTALRVSKIVTVAHMEGAKREDGGKTYELWGLIVNLADYYVGADKGGAVNMFDDFNIDYNQYVYLIETRCSGALVKPFSALVVECEKKTA